MLKRGQLNKHKIKEVKEWRSSFDNYSSPQSFGDASLINFNTEERGEWDKNLIFCPIRMEGDSGDTYVKQAIMSAASGGRGIARVKKPDHISQNEYDKQIRHAANEIIKAYKMWGGIAPDSIYDLANEPKPEARSVAIQNMFNKISDAVFLADMAEDTFTYMIDIYYDDIENRFFALGVRDGKLMKLNVAIQDDEVMLGEFEEIALSENITSRKNDLQVFRDASGKKRFLAIASVATLNRVNEIDSSKLFDSFITYAEITKNFPILNIYHLGDESRVGKADFLARDNYVYVTSGYFDNNPIADAVYETLSREGDKWGNSIEFLSMGSTVENINVNGSVFQTRVHNVGINTAISILLEKDAASVLTTHQSINRGGVVMNQAIKDKLLDLFGGSEELIDEFLTKVDHANEVAMTRISRSVEDETPLEETELVDREVEETVEEVEEVEAETEVEVEPVETEVEEEVVNVELGEEFVNDLTRSVEFQTALNQLVNERVSKLELRIAQLEKQQEEDREWIEDVPAAVRKNRRAVVSYRPREIATTGSENKTFANVAQETLDTIFS